MDSTCREARCEGHDRDEALSSAIRMGLERNVNALQQLPAGRISNREGLAPADRVADSIPHDGAGVDEEEEPVVPGPQIPSAEGDRARRAWYI